MGIWRRHIDFRRRFDGMQAFYLNALLRSLMFALIGIFTPVFIYRTMLPILGEMKLAIVAVAMFYLLIRLVTILVLMPVSKLIEKIGFRRSVILSCVFLALYLGVLVLAGEDPRWFAVGSILLGVNIPLYWISRLSVISQDSSKEKLGRQMGWLSVLEKLAGVLGPVAGGLIIEEWGFSVLYGSAFLVMIVSIWPLLSMPPHTHRNGVTWRGYWQWLTNGRFSHQAIGLIGRSMNDYSSGVIWPLVIVLMGIKLGLMGGLFSLVTLAAVLVRWGSGIVFDYMHRKGGKEDETVFAIASIGQALSWIVRIFVKTVGGVLMVDLGAVIFGTTYGNIADDYLVMGGKRMHEIAYYTYREMTYSVVVIVMMGTMIVGAFLGVWKELMFLNTSLFVVVGIVLARESNLQ